MKNIAAQMVNFDREQMRRIANNMPEQYDEKPQVQQVAQIINGVFSQLLATFPASLANRDQNELNEIRRQWVLAFRENGITTMEQVNAGMRVARRQNRPFLPSPGQFVAWCREEASVIAGLPNVSELVDMVYEYCRKRGLYPDAESYPWKSNAHYWLVTNLYQNMRANALTDAELRRKAADELVHMTARINRGDAKAENDALRRKLDNGGRVLVKGKCPVPSSAETSSASGMGNDASVELSPVAGRNVLGIRDGIISDQTALRTLQEYIRTQCLR